MEIALLRLQRALDRVELVSGLGVPGREQMCIMALVACLAGEGHTDQPRTASPLIRAFAIPVNDEMPDAMRQRLKPFAPRIIGTNDGRDAERADLLRAGLAGQILPRARRRYGPAPIEARHPLRLLDQVWHRMRRGEIRRRIDRLVEQSERGLRPGQEVQLAAAAGRLLALCARDASDPREADWYWTTAISLLDRMCEVGAEARPLPQIRADRIEALGPVAHRLAASGATAGG
ncbi:hypothetical protein [Caldovatus aquaticus]|uniref:GPP34 family phosphoprotein n=1 Tax=Caldovatus aquaticus TaxID=2865671 RepID=A0ABS7EZJ6_9PROT|nr:hypothetical protein [Caldovatus aquaticus]MBW8268782.1 hypothetical protein [Caldovatus aquaticus]